MNSNNHYTVVFVIVVLLMLLGLAFLTLCPKKPRPQAIYRKAFTSSEWWFVPNKSLTAIDRKYFRLVLENATFDPRAPGLMFDDVIEPAPAGIVRGWVVKNEERIVMSEILDECLVKYDRTRRRFHDAKDQRRTITTADLVFLESDGTARACWLA